jgi:hypothetical protein
MHACVFACAHTQASGVDLQTIFDRLPILELKLASARDTLHIYPRQYMLYGGQAAFQITHTGLSDAGVTLFVLGDVFLRAGECSLKCSVSVV